MSSNGPCDRLFAEEDLPTSGRDVQALREHRPRLGADWLEQLTALATQAPPAAAAALRRRPTSAGRAPLELISPSRSDASK
jgi:hypothetical protein